MTDKPIPLRSHRPPEPLILPKHPTLDERIERTFKRLIYRLMRSEETINIAEMSFEEFELFWQRVMQEDE